ncbi:uncharacterized protein LOC134206291 [Armigeres subalbatus]|uniref:uncharacterized protein LOC134206291 n=1 Tax=Armigeres subalbatus TaxID=124917 RepID=UPI002ED30353
MSNARRKESVHSNSPSSEISNNELARLITNQGKAMQDEVNKLRSDLREEISRALTEIKADLAEVDSKLGCMQKDVNDNSEAIARSNLSNDLIISGVPYTENEDLLHYFRCWCKIMGYAENSVPLVDIRRLTRSPPKVGNSYFILLQFAITNQRNDFFLSYLRNHSLNLNQIGFQTSKRVYVNENLTPTTRKIKSMAIEMRKAGKLVRVSSRDGQIIVKVKEGERDVIIKTEEDLRRVGNADS